MLLACWHIKLAVPDVALVIAIGEAGCKISQVALPDRLTAQRAEGVRVGRPAVHEDEFHLRPPGEVAHTGDGRILEAALSTIALRKTGTLIAAANPIIVSTNSSMAEPPSLQAIRGSVRLARTAAVALKLFLPAGFLIGRCLNAAFSPCE